ncbi:MAG: HD domain-containing phosphohydrolase [Gaiellales bacterium]
MITGRHVYPTGESGGIPLLATGVVITEAILQRMHKAGIEGVVVDDEFSAGIESMPPVTDETRRQAVTILKDAFRSLGREETTLVPEQVQAIESVIAQILVEISGRRNLLVCLSDLRLFGGDRMQHALDVCVIGSAIAKEFFREFGWKDFRGQRREDGIEDRMVKLGVGLLLQDIGMLGVPESIREKGGILSSDERKIMQQHPLLGIDLLDGSELSPLTKVTIAQHHERFDGSGYPRGLSGDALHDHGQIAAVAETYASMCRSVDGSEMPLQPHEAYRLIVQARGRMFRPEIVDAFIAAVAPYGPGATVVLEDGRYAIVVENHAGAALEPVVRITHDSDGIQFSPPIELDLRSTNGTIQIKAATPGLPSDHGVELHSR